MSRQRRLEDKRQRRKKRLDKKRRQPADAGEAVGRLIRDLRAVDVPEPGRWPGAVDRSLERPDLVKFEYGRFAAWRHPGRGKLKEFEWDVRKGLLGFVPEIDHWVTEEFFWHGSPGDDWHPLEAFLEREGERFSPAAQEQLRRWKQARIGTFEVGEVRDDTVVLREWDPVASRQVADPVRAITLNIGGVNVYRSMRGRIMLTYLAPWSPDEGTFCGMGYGVTGTRDQAAQFIPLLGLRHPELIAQPRPWRVSPAAEREFLARWKSREWHGWLQERLRVPFDAVIRMPPSGRPRVYRVLELLPSTAAEAREFGIYFEVPLNEGELVAIGATTVLPVDVTSPNMLALAEYNAYRERVGPPPGAAGRWPDRAFVE